jgi:hypothetical protein
VSSWQAAYRGIVPDTLLDSLSVEAWTGLWQERLSRADQTINLVSVFAESVIGLITADQRVIPTVICYEHKRCTRFILAPNTGVTGTAQSSIWRRKIGCARAGRWTRSCGYSETTFARRFYEGQGLVMGRSRASQATHPPTAR